EDGIRDFHVTGVQTCALPIYVTVLRDPVDRWYSEFYYIHKAKDSRDTYVPPPTMDYLNSPHAKFIATNYVRFFSSELHFHHFSRSEERRVGKECRSRRSPYH